MRRVAAYLYENFKASVGFKSSEQRCALFRRTSLFDPVSNLLAPPELTNCSLSTPRVVRTSELPSRQAQDQNRTYKISIHRKRDFWDLGAKPVCRICRKQCHLPEGASLAGPVCV